MKRFSIDSTGQPLSNQAVSEKSDPGDREIGLENSHENWLGKPTLKFFTPLHYTPSYRYPLVVYLHGRGGAACEVGRVMPHISSRNYVAVGVGGNRAINHTGSGFEWNFSPAATARSSDAVFEAIRQASLRSSVNSSRIVLVGRGEGGSMALKLAAANPGKFVGVVSIGGHMPKLTLPEWDHTRDEQLPILFQWGRDNPQYTETSLRRDCRIALSIGAKVNINQYPIDDEMDTLLLADVDRWIMSTVAGSSTVNDRTDSHPIAYSWN